MGRYRGAYFAYANIKEDLSERKIMLLYPSCGLCTALTSLSLTNIVDISIEFDKKASKLIFHTIYFIKIIKNNLFAKK